MKRCVVKILVLLLLCYSEMIMAQSDRMEQEKLEEIFKVLKPAERKTLIENYLSVLHSSLLSAEERGMIDSIFQDLRDLRVTVVPELRNYMLCVSGLGLRGEKENLKVCLEGLQKALASSERKRMVVKSYLESVCLLAHEQVFYAGNAFRWRYSGKMAWHTDPLRVDFQEGDLLCMTPKDTIQIYGTSGTHRLGTTVLELQGGEVRWKENEDMRAVLGRYTVDLKGSDYVADSVVLHYESKYTNPIRGYLKDNALKYTPAQSAVFPEFVSYDTDIEIRDIHENIHFKGGVTYRGTRFYGTGTDENPALLHIVPHDSIAMKLYSKQFSFDSSRVISGHAAMEIVMDSGAITHTDIHFLYTVPQHTVSIKRISDQSIHLPFKDSYHQVLFNMEEIFWPLDSNYMEMRMSSRSGLKATIESMSFFSDDVYDKIQGMDEINPLNGLLKCSLALDRNTFTIAEYAEFIKKSADQLRKQVVLLSYDDFVHFNETKDEVTLKQRLFDYTKARVGKQDYDNIRFTSQPNKLRVNAIMDVRNYNLRIIGVEKLMISEARNIFVEPSDRQVLLMKNRDMSFNGKLNAGMFDMYGQNLFFSYDKYAIALPKVDSSRMYAASRNQQHARGKKIQSLIRDMTGEIVIDKPNNKSGKQEDPGYPILKSTGESYVYFDEPAIQRGQYKRDSFYYKINPYTLSGINDGTRFNYAFDGTLISNIVSPIHDTLRLQEDHSLGLVYETQASGIELYNKGRIYSRIVLNRQGFIASGKVDMNKSHFYSDTILMLPSQLLATTRELKVDSIPHQRPSAFGERIRITYLPKDGSLQGISTVRPFDLYANRVKHAGTLMVYENSLDASGKLQLEGAELHAKLFHLQSTGIHSQSTALNIASFSSKDIRLNTADVTADIDLVANKGKFVNNVENNRAIFSGSRYVCSFESFTWYMKDAYLNIGIEDTVQLAKIWKIEDSHLIPKAGKNVFVSTNPLSDSLSFIAPLARYDLKTGDIACRWINHIDIANGAFYPIEGKVDIRANGDIQEFEAGRLLCERTDSTKMLRNVNLKLKGRFRFSGSGDYLYTSEEKKKSIIRFSEIGVDSLQLIYAKAVLKEEAPLFLNDGFQYKGGVTLYSCQPNLYFSGYVKLNVDTTILNHSWLEVKDYIDAEAVRIALNVENKNDKQQRIYNGIYLNTDRNFKPYAAFLSNRLFYHDDLLIGGEGKMEWSSGMRQYIVSDTLLNRYYRFRYDVEQMKVSSFGPIDLQLKLPGVTQKMSGTITYDLDKEKLTMNRMLYLLDFTLLHRMETVLLKDFADKKLKNVEVDENLYQKMYEICGKQVMETMDKQLKAPSANLPEAFNQLFVLDSLDLRWNEPTRSYMADGKVTVVAMKGKPIGKVMNIKMEFIRSRSEDQCYLYLYDDQLWYYFEYSDRNLYTFSSNEEYNTIIKTEKAEKKILQDKDKQVLYTITLCPDSKKERFLKRVK